MRAAQNFGRRHSSHQFHLHAIAHHCKPSDSKTKLNVTFWAVRSATSAAASHFQPQNFRRRRGFTNAIPPLHDRRVSGGDTQRWQGHSKKFELLTLTGGRDAKSSYLWPCTHSRLSHLVTLFSRLMDLSQ